LGMITPEPHRSGVCPGFSGRAGSAPESQRRRHSSGRIELLESRHMKVPLFYGRHAGIVVPLVPV
jgi:hypothetical protein